VSDLVDFAKRVEDQLANTKREPHWQLGEADRYMAEVRARRQRFEKIAARLNDRVIQPRLETLSSYFSNASLICDEPAGHCACWFGYCERYPSDTKVAFSTQHDIRFEKVAVRFDASMVPMFIKFN